MYLQKILIFLSFHSNSRDKKIRSRGNIKYSVLIYLLYVAHVVFIILLHSGKNTTAMKLDAWAKSGKIVKIRECSGRQEGEMMRPRLFAAQFAEVRGKGFRCAFEYLTIAR